MSRTIGPGRAARRHADLEAFGADRFELHLVGVLDVEAVADGGERGHAAQHLERHFHRLLRLRQQHRLVHDLARRLFGAGERAAEHDAVAAEDERLGERRRAA